MGSALCCQNEGESKKGVEDGVLGESDVDRGLGESDVDGGLGESDVDGVDLDGIDCHEEHQSLKEACI